MKVITSDHTLHWTKLKGVICRNRQSLKVAQNYRGQHDCLLLLTILFPVSVSAAVSKLLVEPWLTSWWESSWILTWDHRGSHREQQSSTGLPVNITGHQTGTWSVFPTSCCVNVIWWWIKVNIGSIVTSIFGKYTSWLLSLSLEKRRNVFHVAPETDRVQRRFTVAEYMAGRAREAWSGRGNAKTACRVRIFPHLTLWI